MSVAVAGWPIQLGAVVVFKEAAATKQGVMTGSHQDQSGASSGAGRSTGWLAAHYHRRCFYNGLCFRFGKKDDSVTFDISV